MLPSSGFFTALREIWAETQARRFAIFVFVSMLAYSAQELILEPFAGAVFRMTPGQTAGLTGTQHGGVMAGMLLVAIGGSLAGEFRARAMRFWTVGGCIASALALSALAVGGLFAPAWPLRASVFILGAANGAFAVSAIGSMMGLASQGRGQREGVRMGLWGAAQAVAFGAGGLFGTGASDLFRSLTGTPAFAYAAVFALEAALFLIAARLAGGVFQVNEAAAGGAQFASTPISTPEHGVPA
jgi:BCD family chlorophyll transporter-like MFS transporter